MSQPRAGVDLETSLGYLLKEASSALRSAMDEVLRPLGMTVTHYSCLELLAQRNSRFARWRTEPGARDEHSPAS